MALQDVAQALGPALFSALEAKGYHELTPVQRAILSPDLVNRDLRVTSQTGSGKTVAIGFALRELVGEAAPRRDGSDRSSSGKDAARPRGLVVAPTRELALQVEAELSWLFAKTGARVVSATGGASIRDEKRRLSQGPAIVVGTPGRLLDYLQRGTIDAGELRAVVLDEADRMLDLGFREDLEAMFALMPEGRRTHLVSATLPGEVRSLADRVQNNPAHVEGTRLGVANADIDHVIHVVPAHQRVDAIVNLLLSDPGAQTLIFVRTRADVAGLSNELVRAGFSVGSLSGEMEQAARNRALAGFKRGDIRALVATDVAARGIDVQDIARVIHADPPGDADTYTHRSGRTGRAGRRGTSSVLTGPGGLRRVERLLRQARVVPRIQPIPTVDELYRAAEERVFLELTADETAPIDERTERLAARLLGAGEPQQIVARLLARGGVFGQVEPRDVSVVRVPKVGPARGPRSTSAEPGFVTFHVTWGSEQGADTRRLLALVCRRGRIRGSDVGSIRVERRASRVDVAADVAGAFAQAASRPDPRDPRIKIRPDRTPHTDSNSPRRPLGASGKPRFGAGQTNRAPAKKFPRHR